MLDSALVAKKQNPGSDLAKKRWRKLSKPERIAAMRLVAAGGKGSKPKERCPCGAMTLARGCARAHTTYDGRLKRYVCKPI